MAHQRKLGRTADQRKALLRNQVTNLIWYGRIETTEAKAKEVRRHCRPHDYSCDQGMRQQHPDHQGKPTMTRAS